MKLSSSLCRDFLYVGRGGLFFIQFKRFITESEEEVQMNAEAQMNERKEKQQLPYDGSAVLIDALHQQGVEVIFGYPGGAVLPIYDALYKNPIRHVLTRHEQGAIHA